MTPLTRLFRPEILDLRPYEPAQYAEGCLRLNANETPWRPASDESERGLNRYPDAQPELLRGKLAEFYGTVREQTLVTRGSTEGIELLIRALCRTGQDDIVICPPTFGMYEHYAAVQGAGVRRVPLDRDAGFVPDADALLRAWDERCKILFLCSPNNPTGNLVPTALVDALSDGLAGQGLVAVDAAYLEFADEDPTLGLLERHDNVVVLRTLSKALGLAGTRCGTLLGAPPVVDLLIRMMPPYAFSTPCQDAVLPALTTAARQQSAARLDSLKAERRLLADALDANPRVVRVWPSDANFLLLETRDPVGLIADAREAGILIRDFSGSEWLQGAVRITVGTHEQNRQLIEALSQS